MNVSKVIRTYFHSLSYNILWFINASYCITFLSDTPKVCLLFNHYQYIKFFKSRSKTRKGIYNSFKRFISNVFIYTNYLFPYDN